MEMQGSDSSKPGTSNGRQRWLPFRLRLPLPGIPGLRLIRLPGSSNGNKSSSSSSCTVVSTCAGNNVAVTADTSATVTAVAPSAAVSCSKLNKPALKPASDVLAGALARALSQSTIHPLDTLKVRLQTRGHAATPAASSSAAAPAAVRGLSKFGQLVPPPPSGPDLRAMGAGLASLYKGVVGAASGAGIAIGAYFACYGLACNVVSAHTDLSPSAVAFVSGGLAAAGSSVVKVPLAVCIRSVQAGVYPNVFTAASSITAKAGPAGLFTGFFPTLLEDVPDMAVKFAAYESLRQLHRRMNHDRSASPQEDFAMGAFAGALAAAATTPLDVIKTRMMCAAASKPTMVSAAREILATSGPAGFSSGIGARALSNGINSAVFFCFFEAIRNGMQANAHLQAADVVHAWAAQARARVEKVHRLLLPADGHAPGSGNHQSSHVCWSTAASPPAGGGMGLFTGPCRSKVDVSSAGCGGAGATLALAGDHSSSSTWAGDVNDSSMGQLVDVEAAGWGYGFEEEEGEEHKPLHRPALRLNLLARASPLRLEDSKLVMAMQALKSMEESTNPPLEDE